MTVLSTLLKADGMGLAERLSEWLLRRRERQEERNMRQVTAYFGSLLKKRRADAGAILQSVRDYRDCPEVTRKQAELLLEHRFFRYVYQTGYPEWRAVMDALKETRYGMREGAAIPRSVKEAAESPMLRLAAQYKVLEHEYTRRNAPQPLSPEAQAERDAAHRLLNCCMREGDLDALKRLALKGEKPDDSVAIRHGLAEGYRRLEELSREWSEEMRGDNHTVMEQIELREADERGKLMRQAAALYERKTGGRLPGDYLEAVKAERALLHGLARHGWDGQREVPKETVEKYGLTEDFAGIARLRWDYHLSEDNGDLSRDYPEAAMDATTVPSGSGRRKNWQVWKRGCSPKRRQAGNGRLRTCGRTTGQAPRCRSGGNKRSRPASGKPGRQIGGSLRGEESECRTTINF